MQNLKMLQKRMEVFRSENNPFKNLGFLAAGL